MQTHECSVFRRRRDVALEEVDRQGGVTDPSGNIWWISTRVVQEPYD